MKESMVVSFFLFFWPLFVLGKNLPKGEIVGYLCVGFTLAKTIFMYDVGYDVPTSWHGSVCPV